MENRGRKFQIGTTTVRLYARHSPGCPQADNNGANSTCRCLKYMQYQSESGQKRVSTEEWEWAKAEAFLFGKFNAKPKKTTSGLTVADAIKKYLAWRHLEKKSNRKHETMTAKLLAYCAANGIGFLSQIETSHLSDFKRTLPYKNHLKNSSSMKVHWSMVSAFFAWCIGEKHIRINPMPSGPQHTTPGGLPEVEPFTDAQVDAIIAAASKIERWNDETKQRMRVFTWMMRWSGLAIGDTARLRRTHVKNGRVLTNRTKTRGYVYVRLPQFLVNALANLKCEDNSAYYFWVRGLHGQVLTEKTIVEHYEYMFRVIFKAAGLDGAHTHQFRHLFITSMLSVGKRVEDVADMVGNSPTEIRKTYKHWIREMQERLDNEIADAWTKMGMDAMGNPLTQSVQ